MDGVWSSRNTTSMLRRGTGNCRRKVKTGLLMYLYNSRILLPASSVLIKKR